MAREGWKYRKNSLLLLVLILHIKTYISLALYRYKFALCQLPYLNSYPSTRDITIVKTINKIKPKVRRKSVKEFT